MKRSAWRYLWSAQDIRRKLLVTVILLAIYRLASHVPVPGVNREALSQILAGGGAPGTLVNLLDLLSGGTVSNFSVLAMGVYPYITAQIILQLLVPIIPALQAIGQINLFSQFAGGVPVLDNFGFSGSSLIPSLAVIISMTAGTMFAI